MYRAPRCAMRGVHVAALTEFSPFDINSLLSLNPKAFFSQDRCMELCLPWATLGLVMIGGVQYMGG